MSGADPTHDENDKFDAVLENQRKAIECNAVHLNLLIEF